MHKDLSVRSAGICLCPVSDGGADRPDVGHGVSMALARLAPKPIAAARPRAEMILSRPEKAPPQLAFIDLGDQFIALQKSRKQPPDNGRHFDLVVDNKEAARGALDAASITPLDGPFLDFRDPWGNRIEIVGYDNIQFAKARTSCAAWV